MVFFSDHCRTHACWAVNGPTTALPPADMMATLALNAAVTRFTAPSSKGTEPGAVFVHKSDVPATVLEHLNQNHGKKERRRGSRHVQGGSTGSM